MRGAPDDGGAWISADRARRVVRGGSWNDPPRNLRSASRSGIGPEIRYYMLGFRAARPLSRNESATHRTPFVV
jgi:formylglycine-generating enzyme required for sulfatase activity